jgi:hypothetical protein
MKIENTNWILQSQDGDQFTAHEDDFELRIRKFAGWFHRIEWTMILRFSSNVVFQYLPTDVIGYFRQNVDDHRRLRFHRSTFLMFTAYRRFDWFVTSKRTATVILLVHFHKWTDQPFLHKPICPAISHDFQSLVEVLTQDESKRRLHTSGRSPPEATSTSKCCSLFQQIRQQRLLCFVDNSDIKRLTVAMPHFHSFPIFPSYRRLNCPMNEKGDVKSATN